METYQWILLAVAGLLGVNMAAPQLRSLASKVSFLLPKGQASTLQPDSVDGDSTDVAAKIQSLRIEALGLVKSQRDAALDYCDGLEKLLSGKIPAAPSNSAELTAAQLQAQNAANQQTGT